LALTYYYRAWETNEDAALASLLGIFSVRL